MAKTKVSRLAAFSDTAGNRIEYDGDPIDTGASVVFTGANNVLRVASNSRIGRLSVEFDCDNGYMEIGSSSGVPALHASVRLGQDSRLLIGENVSATSLIVFSATEGTTIHVGDDVMFASAVQVRADDGHPIFDVSTGERVNPSRPIVIGDHVWVGLGARILGGARIGEGSVVATGAIAKGKFPNNCIIAGVPARVVKRNVAWERPHLSLVKPYYKPDASSITKSRYWHLTKSQEHNDDPSMPPSPSRSRSPIARVRHKLGGWIAGNN